MSIEIRGISKNYGNKTALSDVDLTLENGIYGLLGPNGAGKTTLINILVTVLRQTKGQVLYNGKDIRERSSGYLNVLGFMPQAPRFYPNYTAREFMKYMSALKGIKKQTDAGIDKLLGFVGLSAQADERIGALSGGMKQRLGIAQAMLNDPSVLILDEPTAGLDPSERIRLRNLFSELSGDRTVLIATHIVPDIEYIANEVIILREGRVCDQGSPLSLMNGIYGKVWTFTADQDRIDSLMTSLSVSNVRRTGEKYDLRVVADSRPDETAVCAAPTLEDVFLYRFGADVK